MRPDRLRTVLLTLFLVITIIAPAQEPADPAAGNPAVVGQADELVRFADGAFRRGFYQLAASMYQELVTKFPDFGKLPEAYFNLAEAQRMGDQPEAALKTYNLLRERFPEHEAAEHAALSVARMHIDRDQPQPAIDVLEAANPAKLTAAQQEERQYYLGIAYNQTKQIDLAVKNLLELAAKELDAEHVFRAFARLQLAYIYLVLEQPEEAKRLFLGLSLAPASQVSDDIRQEAWFQMGEIHFAAKQFREAANYYTKLLEAFPDTRYAENARSRTAWSLLEIEQYGQLLEFLAGQPSTAADILYLQAVSCRQLHQFQRAIDFYAQLRRLHPGSDFDTHAWFDLIDCRYRLKHYAQVVQEAPAFITAHGDTEFCVDTMFLLAQSHLEFGQLEPAAQVFEDALKRFWETWDYRSDALMSLADIYRRLGRQKDAAATYQRLADLRDGEHSATALLLAGEAELQAEDLTAAHAIFVKVVEQYPNTDEGAVALLNMAEIMIQMKDAKQALARLNQFIETYPEHRLITQAVYQRGVLAYDAGQAAAAIIDFEAVVTKTFAQQARAKLYLAYAYWETKREADALNLFAELLQDSESRALLEPDHLLILGARYLELNNFAAAEHCYQVLSTREDTATRLSGMHGLGQIQFEKGNWQAAEKYFFAVKNAAGQLPGFRANALAYLGECLRQQGKPAEAAIAIDEALKLRPEEQRAAAVASLAKARLLYEDGKLEPALNHATPVFILWSDAKYTPAAMLLAMRIWADQGKLDNATATFRELAQRYPTALSLYQTQDENRELLQMLSDRIKKD